LWLRSFASKMRWLRMTIFGGLIGFVLKEQP